MQSLDIPVTFTKARLTTGLFFYITKLEALFYTYILIITVAQKVSDLFKELIKLMYRFIDLLVSTFELYG
jgi:hypothetical protein